MPYLPGMSLSEVKKIMADAEVPFDEELNVIYLSTKHSGSSATKQKIIQRLVQKSLFS